MQVNSKKKVTLSVDTTLFVVNTPAANNLLLIVQNDNCPCTSSFVFTLVISNISIGRVEEIEGI